MHFQDKRLFGYNAVTLATSPIFFFTTIHFLVQTYQAIKKIWLCFVLPWGGVTPISRPLLENGRSTIYRQIPSNERYCTFCDENAIEDEIHFLCTCNFYSKLRDTLFHNINSIEPTVVNISAMSGIDLLTFLMNVKFVKCVADFISNAWYKRQHALFN